MLVGTSVVCSNCSSSVLLILCGFKAIVHAPYAIHTLPFVLVHSE